MTPQARDATLRSDDGALRGECAVDAYRASGPGGQKRNKTSSAVRLRHHPSGLIVIAEESRSQHENLHRALSRLRMAIALQFRADLPQDWRPPPEWAQFVGAGGRLAVALRNPLYPLACAIALDALAGCDGRLAPAAARLGVTTSQLAKFLRRDGKLTAAVEAMRR